MEYRQEQKNIFQKAAGLANVLLSVIFPDKCAGCGRLLVPEQVTTGFCSKCSGSIFFLDKPDISETAASFEGAPEKIYCACRYAGAVRKAIISLKYGGKAQLVKALSRLLFSDVAGAVDFSCYDFICAVPASREKIRERGYNQAELLAMGLSSLCGLPYMKNVLLKTRDLPSQSLLNMEERLASVKGIFHVAEDFSGSNTIRGKRIIIVDDVLTTGATITECARMLWEKGAESVSAVILATGKRNL